MRTLYERNTANFPRLKTDTFFADYENRFSYQGVMDKAIRSIENVQLLDRAMWKRFADQFRIQEDSDGSWRGEFWGKMMRGAALTYSYTQNSDLYEILTETVADMLTVAEADGRVSSYSRETEFTKWDLWCRKYVLLGMQYYLEICTDEGLKQKVLTYLCRQADYILDHIGPEGEGKKPVTESGERIYRGANAASILEPMVRLYNLTGQQRYLDFCTYLVENGTVDVANLFRLAYEDQFKPYQYPVTKAYEVMSCFEGLLEYYRVTGENWQKEAAIRFADRLLETEFTVVGSCGCTFEFFDHAAVRQASPENDLAQETCVTVTMMKYLYQLHLLTGDPKYADAFEISLYNAYFGAFNTENQVNQKMLDTYPGVAADPFPFDSYSPLTADVRGKQVGGLRLLSDGHCYGCCAAIGAAGNGLAPKMQLLTNEKGFVMNLYFAGKVKSGNVTFATETGYPAEGNVRILVEPEQTEEFSLSLRIPGWSKETKLTVNGQSVPVTPGYTVLQRKWQPGDRIELSLDLRIKAVYPVSYGSQILMNNPRWKYQYIAASFDVEHPKAKDHIALQRGPVILAQDSRLGYDPHQPADIQVDGEGYVAETPAQADFDHTLSVAVPLKDGKKMRLVDYGSAGKRWSAESTIAAWILTK